MRQVRAERDAETHESYRPPTAPEVNVQALPTRIVTRSGGYGMNGEGNKSGSGD